MKRILYTVLLTMTVLAGCSSSFIFGNDEATPRVQPQFVGYTVPPNFIPQSLIITALGDSLSQGVGDEENRGGYVGRLTAEIREWPGVYGAVVENTAKRGRRSDQLLAMFQKGELTGPVTEADYIVMTIGGNDIMRIVKRDLFNLTLDAFREELIFFENRYMNIYSTVRSMNPQAPFIVIGLYNPFSLITDEAEEFDQILSAYNEALEGVIEDDPQACFVPVEDLFIGNENLVYHTDFFHPNAKGYSLMAERIVERMGECGMIYENRG